MSEPEKDKPKEENVGYCNPPKHTRFQAGVSGNVAGRPRGKVNMVTLLERTLREPIVINENGQRKTMTKMQAAIKKLVSQATSGNLAALRMLMPLVVSAEQRTNDAQGERFSLNEADQKVIAKILERFERSTEEE